MSELDKEIHERLFGKCWHSVIFDKHKNHHVCQKCEEIGLGLLINKPPQYSTDNAAAIEVAEKMYEKGFLWRLVHNHIAPYQVEFFNLDSGVKLSATAEMLPLAICEAAKLVLEGEK